MTETTLAVNMAEASFKPIETWYGRHRFRSRTEARWAVFLQGMGFYYDYESEGFDLGDLKYLPDFYIFGEEMNFWLEIKGVDPTNTEIAKAARLASHTKMNVLIAVGTPAFKEHQLWVFAYTLANAWANDFGNCKPYIADNWYGTPIKFMFAPSQSGGLLAWNEHLQIPVRIDGPWSGNWETIENSCLSATRARFEHGENG